FLTTFAGADAADGGDRRVQGVLKLRLDVRLYSSCRDTCHALQNGCRRDFVFHDNSPQLSVISLHNASNFIHRYFLLPRMLLRMGYVDNNLLWGLGEVPPYFFSASFTLSGRNIFSAAPVTVRRGTKRCVKIIALFAKLGITQCLPSASPSSPRRATSSAF